MEDSKIIDMYWSRSELAIKETAAKYGRYCYSISYNILYDKQDAEECVNDTYMHAWNSMPPKRPDRLSVFLGKITRNLSIDKYKYKTAQKREKGQTPFVLEELRECVPHNDNIESITEDMVIVEIVNDFLKTIEADKRKIFVRRYWYMSSIKEIAKEYSLSESKVKMTLLRLRLQLKQLLEEGGVCL